LEGAPARARPLFLRAKFPFFADRLDPSLLGGYVAAMPTFGILLARKLRKTLTLSRRSSSFGEQRDRATEDF
jgi:hypothetical protein